MNPRSETPKEEGPWGWQSREAAKIAGQLGPNHYAVYHALTHFQSAAGVDQKRRFAASDEQLAEHIGASKNTVSRCLPDLAKAGLIRIFSGANGGLRATRNAFCLLSISHPSQGHGNTSQGELVKPCGGEHVKPSQVCKKRTENKYNAGPKAPAVVLKKEEAQPTCSPLTGGSGPRTNPDIIHDFSHLPERDRAYMVAMRAIAAEADAEIAEQVRKKREAENFS